ncbi:MAG: hypothetical protein HUJ26_03835 [Planctomycetaceae bacterium]|nr:hypothetical protein [Planctomycetaceae bacterium]
MKLHALSVTSLLLLCVPFQDVQGQQKKDQQSFGVYSSYVDKTYATALIASLKEISDDIPVVLFDSLETATQSEADVLVIAMPRRGEKYSEDLLDALKHKKVIAIDYGAAQLFEHLGLEIKDGACAHFGNQAINIVMNQNQFLKVDSGQPAITPYANPSPGDNFGVYAPEKSNLAYATDVIARLENDPAYTPLIRQGNYVLSGLSCHPKTWSDDYHKLFQSIAFTLLQSKSVPFGSLRRQATPPGEFQLSLDKAFQKEGLSSRELYFCFKKPTKFSAQVTHNGSNSVMLFFTGEKDQLHLTRRDAKKGVPLTITVQITEKDLEQIGDAHWTLSVTNFDRNNSAECLLKVDYDPSAMAKTEDN